MLYLTVFAAALFLLPYAFRVSPSVSASYVYQFNNRVATVVFIAGVAGFCWLTKGLGLPVGHGTSRVALWARWLGVLWCVGIGLLLSAAAIHQPLAGESIYFLDRLNHLNVGDTIYRNFEFPYGPIPLYLPFWTAKLLHLTLHKGYLLAWIFMWAIGVWILSLLVDAIEIPARSRTSVFLILLAHIYPFTMWNYGINYSPLRFLLTGTVALFVYRIQERRGVRAALIASILAAAVAASISPEAAIGFMLGSLIFFGIFVRERPKDFWLWFGTMVFAFAAIVFASFRAGIYTTLHAFSSGAYNYPILPAPANLAVLFVYMIAASAGYAAYRARRGKSLLMYILCISLFSMPSCFGRADYGHMETGAMAAIIVGALAISVRRIFWIPVVIFFAVINVLSIKDLLRPTLAIIRESVEHSLFAPGEATTPAVRASVSLFYILHDESKLSAIQAKERVIFQRERGNSTFHLPADPHFTAPFGYTDWKRQSDTSGRVDYGYFDALQDVFLPSQVRGLIVWIDSHPERPLILPSWWQDACYTYSEGSPKNILAIYWFPYVPPQRRIMKVYYPLCDFIRANYSEDLQSSSPSWSIWRRR